MVFSAKNEQYRLVENATKMVATGTKISGVMLVSLDREASRRSAREVVLHRTERRQFFFLQMRSIIVNLSV
jgi:hypothetical protein